MMLQKIYILIECCFLDFLLIIEVLKKSCIMVSAIKEKKESKIHIDNNKKCSLSTKSAN